MHIPLILATVSRACDVQPDHRHKARLARENARLKTLVGALTLELKNSDELLG